MSNHDDTTAQRTTHSDYAVPARITTDADYTITYRNEHGILSMVALPGYELYRARMARIERSGGHVLDYTTPRHDAESPTMQQARSQRAHATHKATPAGRALTLARRAARMAKRA